ncbi:MAG: hypothetical protein K2J38_06600, partial [Muribaculaceae bacterium]|nr:hypothetical protein [Muribaculaceae bacterium]
MAAIAVSASAAATATDATAKQYLYEHQSAWHQTASVFHDNHAKAVRSFNDRLAKPTMRVDAGPNGYIPASSNSGMSSFGDIDGPDGELWYYSASVVQDTIPPHGDVSYTDYILREYEFTIYDEAMNVVGTVKDKVDYAASEVRVVSYSLLPIVTSNFFNTDDKYEVIISLAVNTTHMVNNYRNLVYSIGGEKDADGCDVRVWTSTDFLADVIEGAPRADGSPNYFITFSREQYDAPDEAGFWDFLINANTVYMVYTSATSDSEGPVLLSTQKIPMMHLQGDQQDAIPMLSMREGEHTYFVMPMYEEPFYNRYDNPMDDMSQREGNTLRIRIFEATPTSFTQVWDVPVPVAKTDDETIVASYFSVGSLNYHQDILFDENHAPTFVVTKWDYTPSSDDSYIKSYYLYDSNGTRKAVLAENCDQSINLPAIDGQPAQMMFIRTDNFGDMYFDITNLTDGKVALSLPQMYEYSDDAEIEPLTASVTRIPEGDSYVFCFELRVPEYDEATGEDIMRFIWIDANGKFRRIDRVSMGQRVQYAQSYLAHSKAVMPGTYTNEGLAYMMLIKRGIQGTETREELLIATPMSDENNGKVLLNLVPDERGNLSSIIPDFREEGEQSTLSVY